MSNSILRTCKRRRLSCLNLLASLLLGAFPACANEQQPIAFTSADAANLRSELVKTLPKTAKILTVCGPSEGYEYYPNKVAGDAAPPEWGKGAISNGRFVFISDGKDFDVLFIDAVSRQSLTSVRDQEGTVIKTYAGGDGNTAIYVAAFPGYPNVETYALLTTGDGEKVMLWTATRPLAGDRSPLAKVGAFRAKCF